MKKKYFVFIIFILLMFSGKQKAQELIYPDFPTYSITDLTFVDDSTGYFITNLGSIYITNNGGITWKLQNHFQRNELTQIEFIDKTHGFIYSPFSFIGDNIGLLYNTEETNNFWSTANISMNDVFTFLPISQSKIIKSDNFGKIWMMDNFYGEWNVKYEMLEFQGGCILFPYGEIVQFHHFDNKRILALCNNRFAANDNLVQDSLSFILESIDEGNSWDTLWIGLENLMQSFTFANDSLGWMVGENAYIYNTNDGGKNWNIQYANPTYSVFNNISAVDSNDIFAINDNKEVIISNNGGISWEKKNINLSNSWDCKIEPKNIGEAFVFGNGLIKTNDNGESWEKVCKSLDLNFSKIDFVSEKLGWGVGSLGILNTTDGGRSWNLQYKVETINGISHVEMIDSLDGWAILDRQLFHTENGGISWNTINLTSDINHMRGLTFLNKDVGVIFEFRNNSSDAVFNVVTTDGGKTWKDYLIEAENKQTEYISSFFKMQFTDKDHLWFVNQQGVWLSRDTAKTWEIIDSNITCLAGFDFYDSLTAMVAVDHKQMAFTNDGCKTWEYVDNPFSFQTNDIEIIGETYQGLLTIACGYDGTIVKYYYDDGIFDFVREMVSYTNYPLFDIEIFIDNKRPNIWWAGHGSTIVYSLSEYLITDIEDDISTLPQIFALEQNYPNPFNPSTTIKYSIPFVGNEYFRSSNTTLKVFDILGREVATLVNKQQKVGNYEVIFDASNLSSGVYFYRLQSGNFVETKKLVLLR